MKNSISYYLTLFIIKLKGLKANFSQDPIDFKKIRKQDVHEPKGTFYKESNSKKFKVSNTIITEIKPKNASGKLILFIHGGAFISGPGQHHWDSIREIIKHTNQTVWMCDYPKAPENGITEISNNIDAVYKAALENYKASKTVLIGDSAGGTLVAALIQRLIQKQLDLPLKIILISPIMDSTMTNPKIDFIDKVDPMLSKIGVLSAKKMCAKNTPLSDAMISPINGSFANFPKTILFLAQNDISFPDQELVVKKLMDAQCDLDVIIGENMPHIWPYLPVMKEAKMALKEIIDKINS